MTQAWNFASDRVDADLVLYAKWTPNQYTITFDRQSGSGGSDSVSAVFGQAMPAATAPTRAGYSFGGCYSAPDGGGTQYYNGSMGSVSNWNIADSTTLFAFWNTVQWTVSFTSNGGTGTPPAGGSYSSGQSFVAPGVGDMVKDGLVFVGWNLERSGTIYLPGVLVPTIY